MINSLFVVLAIVDIIFILVMLVVIRVLSRKLKESETECDNLFEKNYKLGDELVEVKTMYSNALEAHERDIKEQEFIVNNFRVSQDSLVKSLDGILRSYTISNKTKILLIKYLYFLLLAKLSAVSIDELKPNRNSIGDNARYLKDMILNPEKANLCSHLIDVMNATLTLILYKPKN